MKRKITTVIVAVSAGLSLLSTGVHLSQTETKPDMSQIFNKSDVMIPMRDGLKLHTEIYVPKDAKEPLPSLNARPMG